MTELVDSELHQLRSVKASLKEDVAVLLLEEKNWILSLPEALAHFTKEGTETTSSRCSVNVDEAYEQDLKGTSEGGLNTSCSAGDSAVCLTNIMVLIKGCIFCFVFSSTLKDS